MDKIIDGVHLNLSKIMQLYAHLYMVAQFVLKTIMHKICLFKLNVNVFSLTLLSILYSFWWFHYNLFFICPRKWCLVMTFLDVTHCFLIVKILDLVNIIIRLTFNFVFNIYFYLWELCHQLGQNKDWIMNDV